MLGQDQARPCDGACDARRQLIRTLNDNLRRYAKGGLIRISHGINLLGAARVAEILAAVREYRQFTPTTDPDGVHARGAFKLRGQRVTWHIDCFDRQRRFWSPDPADAARTFRVLSIMRSSERRRMLATVDLPHELDEDASC